MIKIEVNEGKLPWVVGIGTILAGVVIAVLCIRYSGYSAKNSGAAFVVVGLIILSGIFLCMDGRNRKLTVEDMNICYVNWLGRKKNFSLDEIGYCKTAMEMGRENRDYLKLYDLQGDKLCKLEYNMKEATSFLQYLLDNKVRVECTEKSGFFLKSMIDMKAICQEEIPGAVNQAYEAAKALLWRWTEQNKKFGVEWKTGISVYLAEELSGRRQLWEQEGYQGAAFHDSCREDGKPEGRRDFTAQPESLPEGYLVLIEAYLLKDGQFVIDKKNRAVTVSANVLTVSKSMQVGEKLKIRLFSTVEEELSQQLSFLRHILPKNRYHTEAIVLRHELRERM